MSCICFCGLDVQMIFGKQACLFVHASLFLVCQDGQYELDFLRFELRSLRALLQDPYALVGSCIVHFLVIPILSHVWNYNGL